MTPLPSLANWNQTRDSLHTAAQVIGSIRKMFIPPQPNALHLPLFVTRDGLTTGMLPHQRKRYELTLDFTSQTFRHNFDGDTTERIAPDTLTNLVHRAASMTGKDLPTLPELNGIKIDPDLAGDYAQALYRVYSLMARFRARLLGMMTPAVVWPHHFDLSFLFFTGAGSDEHHDPHMNFGFAPFSATIDRPYLYVYAWPMPPGIVGSRLPEPAHWFNDDWTGIVVDYDTLVSESDPEAVMEAVLVDIFDLLRPAMEGA